MEKFMKKVEVFFILIIMFLVRFDYAKAADYNSIPEKLNDFVGDEINEEKDTWIETLLDDVYSKEKWEKEDVEIGIPFFVYNPELEYQTPAVDYPLYIKNEMIGVLEFYKYNNNWSVSIGGKDTPYIILESIDMNKDCPIFYVVGSSACGDIICMETKSQVYQLSESDDIDQITSLQKIFKKHTYEKKLAEIEQSMEKFGEIPKQTVSSKETNKKEDAMKLKKDGVANNANKLKLLGIILIGGCIILLFVFRIKFRRKR